MVTVCIQTVRWTHHRTWSQYAFRLCGGHIHSNMVTVCIQTVRWTHHSTWSQYAFRLCGGHITVHGHSMHSGCAVDTSQYMVTVCIQAVRWTHHSTWPLFQTLHLATLSRNGTHDRQSQTARTMYGNIEKKNKKNLTQ